MVRLRLFFFAILLFFLLIPVAEKWIDPDIWWRLRTGDWIIAHHGVPQTDPFSSLGAMRPWVEYSWLFEVMLFMAYKLLGYPGIILGVEIMVFAIVLNLYALLEEQGGASPISEVLALITVVGLTPLFMPRPWLVSILFFILELRLLYQYRKSEDWRLLIALVPLFGLWANIHIQFINGFLILALFTAESMLMPERRRSFPPACATFAGCAVASLFNPYGYRLYPLAYELNNSSYFANLSELRPPDFSMATYWSLPLLSAVALALVWRKGARAAGFLPVLLSIVGVILALRSRRDIWLALIPTGTLIAALSKNQVHIIVQGFGNRVRAILMAIGAVCATLLSDGRTVIEEKVAEHFPTAAVNFMRNHGLKGKIYNTYDWGGYLIWTMPESSVSIDGRNFLYGETVFLRNLSTWNAADDWVYDPELRTAQIVIGPPRLPLFKKLRSSTKFRQVYSDHVAEVFVTKEP